jgi:hypothetical protein
MKKKQIVCSGGNELMKYFSLQEQTWMTKQIFTRMSQTW